MSMRARASEDRGPLDPGWSRSRTTTEGGRGAEQLQVLQHLHDPVARRGAGRHKRQAILLFEQPHRRHRRLHGDRVRLDEVHLQERQQPQVKLPRAGEIALLRELDDLRHLGRHGVRRDRDQPAAADRHHRHRNRIVAAQEEELGIGGRDDLAHLHQAARGFLDADDGAQGGQTKDGRRLEVDAGAPGHVVEHDRERVLSAIAL